MFQYKNRHKDLYVNAMQITDDTIDEINESIPKKYSITRNDNGFTLNKDDKPERQFNYGDIVVVHDDIVTVMQEYVFNNLFI